MALSERQKRVLGVAGGVTAVAVGSYALYQMSQSTERAQPTRRGIIVGTDDALDVAQESKLPKQCRSFKKVLKIAKRNLDYYEDEWSAGDDAYRQRLRRYTKLRKKAHREC